MLFARLKFAEWRSALNVFSTSSYLIIGSALTYTEAASGGVLQIKVLLKILQNSHENNCARASFLMKLQVRPATLLKRGSGTGVSL